MVTETLQKGQFESKQHRERIVSCLAGRFRIITQQLLSWWPHIDMMYNKSAELRAMFIDTLTKVTQGYISHTPLRMIQVAVQQKTNKQNDVLIAGIFLEKKRFGHLRQPNWTLPFPEH